MRWVSTGGRAWGLAVLFLVASMLVALPDQTSAAVVDGSPMADDGEMTAGPASDPTGPTSPVAGAQPAAVVDTPADEVIRNPEVGKPGWTPVLRSEPVNLGRDWVFADLPIVLRMPVGAFKAAVKADVAVLDRGLADQLSPVGAVVAFEFNEGVTRRGAEVPFEVAVDYSDVGLIYGGDFFYRLQLVEYSGCRVEGEGNRVADRVAAAFTASGTVKCLSQRILEASNDLQARVFTAQVDMSPSLAAIDDGFTILAMGSGPSGPTGDFTAAPLPRLFDYQVGLFTGSAELSYPIGVPAAAAGPTPQIVLSYSSGAVDGMHSAANNQPGLIGAGWSYHPGAIIRYLKGCDDGTGHMCSVGDEYTMSLGGTSSPLVQDGTDPDVFHLQANPYWRIERKTGAPNSDHQGHYWVVTTQDGIEHRFGYDNTAADYTVIKDASECAATFCDVVYQWNLDRVEDPNGNQTVLSYGQEFNFYDDPNQTDNRRYIRASRLEEIEYTTFAWDPTRHANARILFNNEFRCGNASTQIECDWPADFLDTPTDLECQFINSTGPGCQTSPTYWTQFRLDSIQTQIWTGGRWVTDRLYDLAQNLPKPPSETDGHKLLLYRIHERPGGDYLFSAFHQTEAEDYSTQSGTGTSTGYDAGLNAKITWTATGQYIGFDRFDFDEGAGEFVARVHHTGLGNKIELRLGSPTAAPFATMNLPDGAGEWTTETITLPTPSQTGIKPKLYLTFVGAGHLNWFRFKPTASGESGLPALDLFNENWQWLNNRADPPTGTTAMPVARIGTALTQLGGQINFTYGQPAGCNIGQGGWDDQNTHCYPEEGPIDPTVPAIWNKYVVTQMTLSDSVSGNPTQTLTYTYTQPWWHKTNLPTRNIEYHSDFRGHSQVTVIRPDGSSTEFRFHQGMHDDPNANGTTKTVNTVLSDGTSWPDYNWLAGQAAETRRFNYAGGPLTRTKTHLVGAGPIAGSGIYASYNTRADWTETLSYGTVNKTSRTEFTYNSYGNLSTEVRLGDTATSSDDRVLQYVYVIRDDVSGYMVDRVKYEKLWNGSVVGIPGDGNEVWITQYAYDGQAIGIPPTAGNVTLVQRFESRGPDVTHDTLYTHDNAGRVLTVTDAEGSVTSTSYHANYGTVASITNTGHPPTSYTYDDWGRPASISDTNGNTTTLTYDGHGRLTKGWAPTEPTSGTATVEHDYTIQARPAVVITYSLLQAGTRVRTDTYFDGFGRVIQTQQNAQAANTRSVVSRQFNDQGQLTKGSAPYAVSGGLGSYAGQPTYTTLSSWTELMYDDLGNLWQERQKTGSTTLWTRSTVVDGWVTRIYDPEGNITTHGYNAFGDLVSVTEPTGAVTSYSYNPAGWLTGVVDDAANTTTVGYNMMGWKTSLDDPDTGTWTYGYDTVGNLTMQQDAKAQQLYFGYDSLHRLTTIRRDTTGGPLVAEYDYDAAGFDGLLNWSKAHTAEGVVQVTNLAYDANNRLTRQQHVIPGAGGGMFTREWTWGPSDQLQTLTYPGDNAGGLGEQVTYTYDTRTGLPVGLDGDGTYADDTYVSATTYNPLAQPTSQTLGSGVNDLDRVWIYDAATNRLTALQAGSGGSTTNVFDFQIAGYDDNSNITLIRDLQNAGQRQCFTYDTLNRLTEAYTQASTAPTCNGVADTTAGEGGYDHTYTYNNIGNLTTWTTETGSTTYTYGGGPAGPHAVTAAWGNTYAYDANGNQTSRIIDGVTHTLVYDYQNRLTTYDDGGSTGGSTTSFLYDADGNRVKRTVDTTVTIYIGADYERTTGLSLQFTPSSMSLNADEGGAAVNDTTTLSTSDGGTASWSISDDQTWLTAAPTTGTGSSALITVAADPTGLAAGTYNGTVTATATGYDPASLPVTLTVNATSGYTLKLSLSSDRSNPVNLEGQTVAGNIYVFTAPDTADIDKVEFWIDAAAGSGPPYRTENNAPYDLNGGTVTTANPYDTTQLSDGPHTVAARIFLTTGPSQDITANFTVNNAGGGNPTLQFNPTSLSLTADEGGAATNDTTTLSTSDSQTASWSISDDQTWLSAAPTSGTGSSALITVTADPTGLAPGTYNGTVTATANGYDPASLPVTFTVNATSGYTLQLSLSSDRSNPVNLEGQTVAGNMYVFTTPDDPSIWRVEFWIDANPGQGPPYRIENNPPYDLEGGTVTTANPYDTTQLSNGSHSIAARIRFSPAPGNWQDITATFTVNNSGSGMAMPNRWRQTEASNVQSMAVMLQTGGPPTETLYYTFNGDKVAMRGDGNLTLLLADQLGSTSVAWTLTTGTAFRQRYHPYGGIRSSDGLPTDIGYTGQRTDTSTGLMHYQTRYYDPALARFTQADTIIPNPAEPQDLNRYTYVRSNPINHTDPSGNVLSSPIELRHEFTQPGYADWIAYGGGGGSSWGFWQSEYAGTSYSFGWSEITNAVGAFAFLAPGYDCAQGDWGWCGVDVATLGIFGRLRRIANFLRHADNLADLDKLVDATRSADRTLLARATRPADDFVNLASSERTRHILDGEVLPNGAFSGGHRAGTGFGKSEFPASWSDVEIMHYVSDVATDPLAVSRIGRGGDVFVTGTRNGIEIEVLLRNGEIWTAYPTNVVRNPLP